MPSHTVGLWVTGSVRLGESKLLYDVYAVHATERGHEENRQDARQGRPLDVSPGIPYDGHGLLRGRQSQERRQRKTRYFTSRCPALDAVPAVFPDDDGCLVRSARCNQDVVVDRVSDSERLTTAAHSENTIKAEQSNDSVIA